MYLIACWYLLLLDPPRLTGLTTYHQNIMCMWLLLLVRRASRTSCTQCCQTHDLIRRLNRSIRTWRRSCSAAALPYRRWWPSSRAAASSTRPSRWACQRRVPTARAWSTSTRATRRRCVCCAPLPVRTPMFRALLDLSYRYYYYLLPVSFYLLSLSLSLFICFCTPVSLKLLNTSTTSYPLNQLLTVSLLSFVTLKK